MKNKSHSLPVAHAQRVISEVVRPLDMKEKVPLKEAFFRVLAEDITSPIDVPFQDNAAMDGYAFSARGLDLGIKQVLKIAGAAFAGHRFEGTLVQGECVQIMTGGVMPEGCDTVIQQENVVVKDGTVTLPAANVAPGANVRLRGEDVKAGETCLTEGTLLQPAHLGLLASLGMAEVAVKKRPVVAIFSTGDELCPVGTPLLAGSIYDSNRYSLYGMVKRLGCEIIDMGVVRDDPKLIRAAFLEAAGRADAIITTGGVSVGEADYTKEVMADLAEMAFWNISMRPGRPMAFGRILSGERQTCVFGLPGNPVAVMATFYFFVRDALYYLMGTYPAPLPHMRVKTVSPLSKRRGRTEYQRGILAPNEQGEWVVRTTGDQGSGMLSSMTQANCMIILPAEGEAVPAGDTVEVVLFEGLV
ncbi:molybdopterin molybdotransferase MoeA [Oxalobacter vibrioformis]|uniref:Molybdopterin molybdenumtransferase n=1 Tax=Oxalobacter vibrioformis TaxID=933080 RepID=A0A9E9LYM4_9BURK|nr:gephyrin-like molybdotransferase Glp [Oxalobacter vibrioformis]WAW10045.1 molybdopterin molybdotransferase MoeA [Oxalobacter vibrioformis]